MKKQLSYIDSVHRSGTIWNISVMILLLAFPLTVAALFGGYGVDRKRRRLI